MPKPPKAPPNVSVDAERNQQLARIADDLETLIEEYQRTNHILKEIARCVCASVVHKAHSSTLTIEGDDKFMPATINVGGNATATYLEFDGPNGTGNQVPPTGATTYSSDNAAVATVDPATGVCTGVGAGACNISCFDAGLPAPGLPASDVLTVVAVVPVAVSSTLTLVANSALPRRR